MPLSLTLKPDEKAIIGGAAIQNGPKTTTITITNKTVILREKDVLTSETANTPAKRIYFAVQLMYLAGSLEESGDVQEAFLELTRDFMAACPTETAVGLIAEIGQYVITEKFYNALKLCKDLIKYEKSIIDMDSDVA
ncbi:MAG: flagellar biosynthesis repressor FlbT [Rhodospirillaceae bacterium]|nr:flagellar biosynthesis repressor FlbT [Rhodospirillaceae bacterium]